jgi:hypothetical protein
MKLADPSLQCDEAQPVCQRCAKSQRTCYGMTAGDACSIVHIENSYASGQKKRPRGPRSIPAVLLTGNSKAILQPPQVDLRATATGFYLHYHLQTLEEVPNLSKGTSDDFIPIWMSRAGCQILDLAISSMALAVFSRTQQHPPAAIEASRTYHQLLQLARVTVCSLHERNIEVCLLAIFFMSRYEDYVYSPSHLNENGPLSTTLQSFSHHDGASAILKYWRYQLYHMQPATNVIKHTRRGLIRSALIRNLALPEWMREGAFFGECGLELEYDCLVVQIVGVRQRLATLLKDKTDPHRISHELISAAAELNKEAQEIDKALQVWTSHFPATWYHRRHTLSTNLPFPTRDFYSPTVHSYSHPAYAAPWNQYYATRMLINRTRLTVLELIRPTLDCFANEQRLECLSNMTIVTAGLASSLPFSLQRFTVAENPDLFSDGDLITLNTNEDIKPFMACRTVWPLTVASSLRAVEVKQKLWFRSVLARLGRVIGAGVLECAENDEWFQF